MSNPKRIKQDGKVYEQAIYKYGQSVRGGAVYLSRDGRLYDAQSLHCVEGDQYNYYHEVKPEPAPETVTIELHLETARQYATMYTEVNGSMGGHTGEACRVALAARKTKLEVWRGSLDLPWGHEGTDGPQWTSSSTGQDLIGGGANEAQAKLMAAATDLLEALIHEHNFGNSGERAVTLDERTATAIRKALPPEVAAEVLDE